MSMWRLVEIVERFITLSAMPEKKELAIMFIRMVPMEYQVLLTMFG